MRRPISSAGVLIGALVSALTGCDQRLDGAVQNPYAPFPVTVTYDGSPIGSFPNDAGELHTHLRALPSRERLRSKVAATLATPCGPRAIETGMSRDASFDFEVSPPPPTWWLYVDNRGGPARRVTVGSWEWPIAPGQVAEQPVFVEACRGQSLSVALDGAPLGAVPFEGSGALVDAAGSHCYEIARVQYHSLSEALLGSSEASSEPTRLAPTRLHPLGVRLDYLLDEPPPTLKVNGWGLPETRSVLRDCGEATLEIALPARKGYGVREMTDFLQGVNAAQERWEHRRDGGR